MEKNDCLPFLDTLVQRSISGSLSTCVYRKRTHTDRYLQFESHHPLHVKRGVVRCLFDRAIGIARGDETKKEKQHLCDVLTINGYPQSFIRVSSQSRSLTENRELPKAVITIPYVAGLSEDIRRICWRFGVKTVFRTKHTLRTSLVNLKDRLTDDRRSMVVYRVPCSCGKVYVGETKRALSVRIKEHQDAVRLGHTDKSALAEHAWTACHRIDWEATQIVDTATRLSELLVKEAFHIRTIPARLRLNRDTGIQLPDCWSWIPNLMTSSTSRRRDGQYNRVVREEESR